MFPDSQEQSISVGLVTSEISERDWSKIHHDLRFVDLVNKAAVDLRCRVIVHGGYAVDGALVKITRPHNDIDIQLYGQNPDGAELVNNLITKVAENDSSFVDPKLEDKGRKEYYHSYSTEKPGFGADIYYIQITTDPNEAEKVIVKSDGSYTLPQVYKTHSVTLEGVTFEAQEWETELADKMEKRKQGAPKRQKHDQDIANLQRILHEDKKAVNYRS